MTDSDSRSIWKRQEQLDTRPLGRDLWVSRRGTQVSKGARPGAPGSDSLGFVRDGRALHKAKSALLRMTSRAAGHPAFGSPPVGQPARNPGLERRETWGTRLRLPGLRSGQAPYKAKSALLRMTSRTAGTPGLWVATCGSAGEEPRSRKARDLGHPAQTPGLRSGQALHKAKSALLRMTLRTAGHPAFGSPPVGQPARNPGLERRETWGTRLACGNSN